jgi:cell fate (sporulation/competence/biofilm development) regulator YlbF (YheA/YmcA/DUF963 family)
MMSVETDAAADTESSVEEMAHSLGEAVAELPEYRRFLDAKADVEADEKAQAQIDEFESVREEFMIARKTGKATEEDLRELQEAQEELHDLPVMSDFLQAQNELELRLQELNELVSEPLAVDFGEKAGGCCQD